MKLRIDEATVEDWNNLYTGEIIKILGVKWVKSDYGDYVEIDYEQNW